MFIGDYICVCWIGECVLGVCVWYVVMVRVSFKGCLCIYLYCILCGVCGWGCHSNCKEFQGKGV